MRAPMMLHPHRRGRRRLDPAFRRRALPRRPGLGRRQSRPGLLPPRRPARRHRRQCDGRQAACRISSRRSSAPSRTSRSTPTRCATAFAALAERGRRADRRRRSPTASSRIAVENMANAIKKISVQRGYDVTRYALNCFGGAGGQHACLVADALGMTDGADPPVLVAAVGLRHGPGRHPRHAPAGDRGSRSSAKALAALKRDRRRGSARTRKPRSPARACRAARSRCIVRAHIRYAGTDTALVVPAGRRRQE